ncbi:MAG: L-fucokinase [Porphyromonas sp.]|nr:L-fucokinase [Porphyromonas sp.]
MYESIYIVSLPKNHVEYLNSTSTNRWGKDIFFCSDPPGRKLGSGGGSVYAIKQARKQIRKSYHREIVINSDGESRRLPAYSVLGKVMMPLPIDGHEILLESQIATIRTLLDADTDGFYRTAISSGDVLLKPGKFASLPHYDLLCIGAKGSLESASKHGVFIISSNADTFSSPILTLQKPTLQRLEELKNKYQIAIDSGLWLLSQRASDLLFKSSTEKDGNVHHFDLYTSFPHLIEKHELSMGIMYSPSDSGFYHFGSGTDLLKSAQSLGLDMKSGCWIDDSRLDDGWILTGENILTHIPSEMKGWELPKGICVDLLPLKNRERCLRIYGINDLFRGTAQEDSTTFVDASLAEFSKKANLPTDTDIYDLPLFPCSDNINTLSYLGEWLSKRNKASDRNKDKKALEAYLKLPKLSARELGGMTDFKQLYKDEK